MRVLALWIATMLPASTVPAWSRPAMVRQISTAGTVWINATALPSGSSLYNGDTVATAENGFAMITVPGQSRVEVRGDSLVSVSEHEITLRGGVVGSDGLAVRLGDDLIRPAGQPEPRPWFVVADRDGTKLVAAYQGDVVIARAGAEPLLVPRGSIAVPSGSPADDQGIPQSAGNPVPSGADSGWTIFSLSSAASVALVISLGATAVVSTLVGYALGERSVSPSK